MSQWESEQLEELWNTLKKATLSHQVEDDLWFVKRENSL